MYDIDALVNLAADMGLDPGPVRLALATRQYRGEVGQEDLEPGHGRAADASFVVIDLRFGTICHLDVWAPAVAWGTRPDLACDYRFAGES